MGSVKSKRTLNRQDYKELVDSLPSVFLFIASTLDNSRAVKTLVPCSLSHLTGMHDQTKTAV